MVWGSITLVHLLMKNQLVDEYHTMICPVLTGGGRRLFTESSDEITLNLKSCKQYDNGVVFLSYGIDRQKQ
jgi:dihydrofolate reductase